MIKFWLPLNKDERNCGLATGQAVASGITFTDGGPVGKYADFSGSGNKYVRIPIDGLTGLTTACSVSTWVKIDSWNAAWQTIFAFLKTSSPWTGNVFTFIRNSTASALTFSISNGSTSIQTALCTNTLDLNRWYHFVCTYKTGEMKIYQDGVLSKTYSPAIEPAFSQITHAALGVECGTAFGSVSYQHRGGISDFRVFDKTLTAQEVKDLYNNKMFEVNGGLFLEETTNLVSNLSSAGQNNVAYDVATWATSVSSVTNKNGVYTFSAYITNTSDHPLNCRLSCYNSAGTGYNAIQGNSIPAGSEGRSVVTCDTTNTANFNGTIYLYIQNGNAGVDPTNKRFYLREVQFEEKDHATPPSYGHRDARAADISNMNHDIVLYNIIKSGSTFYFNGSNSAIQVPIQGTISGGTYTINIWFYRPTGEWGSKGWETLIGASGFEFESKRSTATNPVLVAYSWGQSSSGGKEYECDKWNMVTLTRTSSQFKAYLNGENFLTTTTVGSVPNSTYYIGAWNSTTQQNFKGYIRDFAVYKKELSQEDITNLYEHGK